MTTAVDHIAAAELGAASASSLPENMADLAVADALVALTHAALAIAETLADQHSPRLVELPVNGCNIGTILVSPGAVVHLMPSECAPHTTLQLTGGVWYTIPLPAAEVAKRLGMELVAWEPAEEDEETTHAD